MVGSAIHRALTARGDNNLYVADRQDLDLTDSNLIEQYFRDNKITTVYLAAAKVGGIHANNTYPVAFIRDNLLIQLGVIDAAYNAGVDRLLFLGSSCIYPRLAQQPIHETELMTGELEPTNESYAIAKIAGIKLCEAYSRQYGSDFRSVMPTNLYGPNDNFHPENSHVVPALIRRFHEAKIQNLPEVVVWGSGKPLREFLYVDDMAAACIHTLTVDREQYDSVTSPTQSHINIGTGKDCSIAELATTIADVVGYSGKIVWDSTKADGTPRKLLNVDKASSLGWKASTTLKDGLKTTYDWFCIDDNQNNLRSK